MSTERADCAHYKVIFNKIPRMPPNPLCFVEMSIILKFGYWKNNYPRLLKVWARCCRPSLGPMYRIGSFTHPGAY